MSVPGPPPGPPPYGPSYGPTYPGPPAMPQHGYGPPPGAPPGRRSGPPVALIVIAVLVVLIGGGGGAYLATISSGAYPKLLWACTVVPPADAASLVPHGLPKGSPPGSGAADSTCTWSNLLAQNTGLEKQGANLTVRVRRSGRDLFNSAEDNAHKALVFDTNDSGIHPAGTPISGYGDEAVRVPKAFGGQFDSIEFRESNLVVVVAVEIDDHPGEQTALAWSRTQRAAALAHQRLRTLR